jgi:hypothetical protein
MKLRGFNARRAMRYGHKLTNVQRAIRVASWPEVHVENQFSPAYGGISHSATMAEGENCERFKDILYSNPAYWDVVDIPMTQQQEDIAYAEAKRGEGTEYDVIGVTSLATEFDIIKPHPEKTWCSKTCARVICAGHPLFKKHLEQLGFHNFNIDPQDLIDEARYYFEGR